MHPKRKAGISTNFVHIVLLLLVFITLYPFWRVVMYSISDPREAMKGGLFLLPRGFSLVSYEAVIKSKAIFTAYRNSIVVTVGGTLINVAMTAMLAYPLSLRRFRGRNALTMLAFFTMLFTGGMIPTYLMLDQMNLLDNLWSLILPTAVSPWNLFLVRNYFQSIPPSLEESASLDGATPVRILISIIVPISMPILATIAIFYGVVHWNSYFNVILYISSQQLQTLPVYLRVILNSSAMDQVSSSEAMINASQLTQESLKMAIIVATVLPMLIVYPYLQRYYIKGILIGSVKG